MTAAKPIPQSPALRSRVAGNTMPADDSPRAGKAVANQISRRLSLSLPTINVVSAALTYIFITYVVPLPGPAPPAAARGTELIAAVGLTGVAWLVSDLWGRRSLGPVLRWLEQERAPDPRERARTLRIPLHEAAHLLVVWSVAGAGLETTVSTAGFCAAVQSVSARQNAKRIAHSRRRY